jgi:hypothetical protein
MFYGQRVMDIPDGLPKWSGINNESDLIEDSPPEKVRELERKREKEREEKMKDNPDEATKEGTKQGGKSGKGAQSAEKK